MDASSTTLEFPDKFVRSTMTRTQAFNCPTKTTVFVSERSVIFVEFNTLPVMIQVLILFFCEDRV